MGRLPLTFDVSATLLDLANEAGKVFYPLNILLCVPDLVREIGKEDILVLRGAQRVSGWLECAVCSGGVIEFRKYEGTWLQVAPAN